MKKNKTLKTFIKKIIKEQLIKENYPIGAKEDPNAPWNKDIEPAKTKKVSNGSFEFLGDTNNEIFYFEKDNTYYSFDASYSYSEEDNTFEFNGIKYEDVIDLVNDQWGNKDLTDIPTQSEAGYQDGTLLKVTETDDSWETIENKLLDRDAERAEQEFAHSKMMPPSDFEKQLGLEEIARTLGYIK